jgi:diaminohydroxyphosphoribosylaminopyrimidine deaminase/5-amino-6-(5-phosphoribosylamino)uracil reductase
VGAVAVRDGKVLGEGYHHRAGEPHAEIEALRGNGSALQGATLYVSLEPCNHEGRTPPCTQAILDAGIARVVIGAVDPNPLTNGSGIKRLRDAGVAVEIANDPSSQAIVEIFAHAVRSTRPYLALKLAMSLDGFITSKPGVQEWLTCEEERLYVRDLRIAHDAVMVGAGTARIDDPQLTVRPPHHRLRPYLRIIVCETATLPETSRVFEMLDDYARTIVLAPAGAREKFANLRDVADVIFVAEHPQKRAGRLGDPAFSHLDLSAALHALRDRGVQSILCEGGPTLGARLIEAGLVDRFYWAIAPRLLANPDAVPVLTGVDLAALQQKLRFDRIERAGVDMILSGTLS